MILFWHNIGRKDLENTQLSCEMKSGLLYQGEAEIVTNEINGEQYVAMESGEKIFALTLLKKNSSLEGRARKDAGSTHGNSTLQHRPNELHKQ